MNYNTTAAKSALWHLFMTQTLPCIVFSLTVMIIFVDLHLCYQSHPLLLSSNRLLCDDNDKKQIEIEKETKQNLLCSYARKKYIFFNSQDNHIG